jgi:hypothetical protein
MLMMKFLRSHDVRIFARINKFFYLTKHAHSALCRYFRIIKYNTKGVIFVETKLLVSRTDLLRDLLHHLLRYRNIHPH